MRAIVEKKQTNKITKSNKNQNEEQKNYRREKLEGNK